MQQFTLVERWRERAERRAQNAVDPVALQGGAAYKGLAALAYGARQG